MADDILQVGLDASDLTKQMQSVINALNAGNAALRNFGESGIDASAVIGQANQVFKQSTVTLKTFGDTGQDVSQKFKVVEPNVKLLSESIASLRRNIQLTQAEVAKLHLEENIAPQTFAASQRVKELNAELDKLRKQREGLRVPAKADIKPISSAQSELLAAETRLTKDQEALAKITKRTVAAPTIS